MDIAEVTRVIQVIIAPVVMVTSCAILVGGVLQQYSAINDRMRAMTRERLDLLRSIGGSLSLTAADGLTAERFREIDHELPELLRRHKLVHNAALMLYVAVLLFVLSMFVIAGATAANSGALATLALLVFLAGTAAMLLGILLIAIEIRASHNAIRYEVEQVLSLGT